MEITEKGTIIIDKKGKNYQDIDNELQERINQKRQKMAWNSHINFSLFKETEDAMIFDYHIYYYPSYSLADW